MDILTTAAATLIRTTGAAIHIGTGIMVMDRRFTSGRHFIGTTVIAFIIRESTIDTIGIGTKANRGLSSFAAGGCKNPVGFIFLASPRRPAPMLK